MRPGCAGPGSRHFRLRAYRDFLKQAARYEVFLARGLDEGFYSPVRQELNNTAQESRQAYNIFVRTANSN